MNGELVVPAGIYFAMGDNRDNSLDSRYWGLVPRENIMGKPAIIFWSYDAPTEDLQDYSISHCRRSGAALLHQDPLEPDLAVDPRLSSTLRTVMAKSNQYGLILAGGRGTRFWPRSRRKHAKQVLSFTGERTLIQQTVDRLKPVLPPERIWMLTNEHLQAEIVKQLPEVPQAARSSPNPRSAIPPPPSASWRKFSALSTPTPSSESSPPTT